MLYAKGNMDLKPIGYKYADAATLLTLSRAHVYTLVKDGKLQRIQVTEGRFVVSYESMVAYMDAARAGENMKDYLYKPKKPRPSSQPTPVQEEKKSMVSGLLARFGLGNNTAGS